MSEWLSRFLSSRVARACLLVFCLLFSASTRAAPESDSLVQPRLGKVHFPITANSAAQAQFDRAVAMLHSFWYEELDREFRKVSELDPNCAMAYWGVAMGLWHPLWEAPDPNSLRAGLAAVERGKSLGAGTPREQAYLDAIDSFYAGYERLGHSARVQRYTEAMEKVHRLYPADTEAAAFYALALLAVASPNDRGCTNQLRAAALLEQVATVQTNHPGVVHYLIHAYDTPTLASRGLPEAWCYSQIAPEVPHALHMPSHIFTRLGLWQDSIRANLASATAAANYSARANMPGTWDEQLHAMDYLVYAYLQTAQDRAAERLVRELRTVNRPAQKNFKSGYALAAIPARYLLERRQWAEVAALELTPQDFPWSNHAWPLALNRFARCVGAARAGCAEEAQRELAILAQIQPPSTETPVSYGFRQVAILYSGARAWTERAERRNDDAVRWMRQAADEEDALEKKPVTPGPLLPAREMLGELLLECGQPRAALAAFERALQDFPRRFNSLYGAARAAEAIGESDPARGYFSQLLTLCQGADSQRPELLAARRALGQQ